jgi:tetratricopeptide (TPR) repeat protein
MAGLLNNEMMLSSLARILFLSIVLTGLLAVSVAAQDVALDGTVTARQPDGSLRAADVIVALIVGQDFANARFTRTNAQGTYSFAAVPRDGTFSLLALLPNPNQPILLTGLKNVRPAQRTRYDIIVELADFEAAHKELEQASRSSQGSDTPKPSTNDEQLADLKASLDEVMRLRDVGTRESFESAIAILQQMLIKVRQQKDQQGEIVVLSLLGRCYTRIGERQKAIDAFQASLPLIRARRDRDMEAITLRNIGLTYDLVGEKQQAVAYLEQALAIFHELGDARNESETRKSYEDVRARYIRHR